MLVNNLPEYDDTFYKEAMLKKNRGKHRNRCILPGMYTHAIIYACNLSMHYMYNIISIFHIINSRVTSFCKRFVYVKTNTGSYEHL